MRVFWPDEIGDSQDLIGETSTARSCADFASTADAEPAILPFPGRRQPLTDGSQPNGIHPDEQSPAERARLISRNSLCQRCRRKLVSLILADDGRRDGSGEFVPGTQTLIGFRCECCHSEWPARAPASSQPVLAVISTGE